VSGSIPPMPTTILLPGHLRLYSDGASELVTAAPTVRAALEDLARTRPALYRNICDETGAVRRHINIFVNTAHMRDREGLDTALAADDTISIIPAVSGG
jgi:molybdopterin synthase sulfur carrier subunit